MPPFFYLRASAVTRHHAFLAAIRDIWRRWQTAAAVKLRSGFERGVRKVTEGIALLPAEVLDEADWKRFDDEGRLFWNMNTASDYEEARRILEAGRK